MLGLSHSQTVAELGMTVEFCAKYCLVAQGQTLFGLESGGICRCGSELDLGAEGTPGSRCATPCPGNSTQVCGGRNLLSIFGVSRSHRRPLSYSHGGCYSHEEGQTAWGATQNTTIVGDLTVTKCARECTRRFEGRQVIFSVHGRDRCSCAPFTPEMKLGAIQTKLEFDRLCDKAPTTECNTSSNIYYA